MNETSNNTSKKILDVAQELIQRHGLNAMSFQDLSDAVGIRKASVHYHFRSKAEMVNALLRRYLVEFDDVVRKILNSRSSGKSKLKRYCDLFLKTLDDGEQDKGCLCGMLMAEMYSLDAEGLGLVQQFLNSNVESISSILDAGVEDGSIAKQKNTTSTAQMVLSTLEGGLLLARCDGGPKRFADNVNRLLSFLSN